MIITIIGLIVSIIAGYKLFKSFKLNISKTKYYLSIGISITIILLLIPIYINEGYRVNKGYVTEWNANDFLQFYGSILSFLGTMVLGVVAIWQGNKSYSLSERIMKLENPRPIFEVACEKVRKVQINGDTAKVIHKNCIKATMDSETRIDTLDKAYSIKLNFFSKPIGENSYDIELPLKLKNINECFIKSISFYEIQTKLYEDSNLPTTTTRCFDISGFCNQTTRLIKPNEVVNVTVHIFTNNEELINTLLYEQAKVQIHFEIITFAEKYNQKTEITFGDGKMIDTIYISE